MEESFVTYIQAHRLKQLGFRWPTYCYYSARNYDKVRRQSVSLDHNTNDGGWSDICSAPTLSHALKWLRDEKAVFVGITYANSPTNAKPMGYEVKIPLCKDKIGTGYLDYESALSAGLDYALKFLEDGIQ